MIPLLLALFVADIAPGQSGIAYKQPQIAADGRQVGIVFGADNNIYYSGSSDQGQTFGAPVLVAASPTLSLGNHRGPRVAFASGAIVITAGVGSPKEQFGQNTLKSWRSTDGGKTWAPGPAISKLEGAGIGFQSVASDGKEKLWAAWLGRENDKLKLLGAHSEDAGANWSAPRVIYESPDGNVCECCHTNVAIAGDGTIYVMFRNSIGGARDLHLATSKDGGASFQIAKLGEGTWPLNACPMDGGGLGEFRGDVVTLWRRNSDLFLAKPGKPEENLGAGRNAAITLRQSGYYAVWSSSEAIVAKGPGDAKPRVLSKSGAFPTITSQGPVVAAWEEDGRIRTERLDR